MQQFKLQQVSGSETHLVTKLQEPCAQWAQSGLTVWPEHSCLCISRCVVSELSVGGGVACTLCPVWWLHRSGSRDKAMCTPCLWAPSSPCVGSRPHCSAYRKLEVFRSKGTCRSCPTCPTHTHKSGNLKPCCRSAEHQRLWTELVQAHFRRISVPSTGPSASARGPFSLSAWVATCNPWLQGGENGISWAAMDELIKEAELLGRLRHPNVVWVYGVVLPAEFFEGDDSGGGGPPC